MLISVEVGTSHSPFAPHHSSLFEPVREVAVEEVDDAVRFGAGLRFN